MIVVIASAWDAGARRVIEQWGPRSAAVLTAADLCRPGWSLQLPDEEGTSVIDGRVVPNDAIAGVLTLRPRISPRELRTIRESDREYVSCELSAFLLAWLTSLRCRVVNRPTATSLCGPSWRVARWRAAAEATGIPTGASDDCIETTVAGDRVFGGDATLCSWSAQLARAAGVELLSLRFSRGERRFVSASPLPPLDRPEIAEAVRACVEGR